MEFGRGGHLALKETADPTAASGGGGGGQFKGGTLTLRQRYKEYKSGGAVLFNFRSARSVTACFITIV